MGGDWLSRPDGAYELHDESEDGLDPAIDWDAKDAQAALVAKKIIIETAAVGIGTLVGGVPGALVGAAAVPLLELVALRDQSAIRNTDRLGQMVTDLSGLTVEQVAAWARERDDRLVLTTAAVHAAFNAATEEKIAALARVLAENLQDDARLDVGLLIVQAISDMAAAHVRVLHAVVRAELPTAEGFELGPDVFAQSQLESRFPNLAPGILPILATLERHGLVSEGIGVAEGNRAWSVTEFGRRCLSYLEESR
jgi:hypothetical protein